MFLALIASATLHLAVAGAALPAAAADTAPNSSWQQVSPYDAPNFDLQAEHELLNKANADRARAGLPPLKMDSSMVRAARAHAAAMAAQKHISHQFSGEPSPSDRIATLSTLHLERTGENVAVAPNVEEAYESLMASPPHRDNLLSPKFNVAGFGVFRQGHVLYIAQDFGLSLATYSVQQAQELVSVSVEKFDYSDGNLRVRVKIAVFSYPGKDLRGEVPSAATAQGTRPGDTATEDQLMGIVAARAAELFSQNFR